MKKKEYFSSYLQAEKQFPITALREIKLLKSLNHENVIGLTEMAIERGLCYSLLNLSDDS
jgi:hypothetical protein